MSGFMIFGGRSKFPIITSLEIDKEQWLFYLEKQLKYEGAKHVTRKGDLITFSGNIYSFIVIRRFLMTGSEGSIKVTAEGEILLVTYNISFMWLFVFSLIGVLIIFLLLFNSGASEIKIFLIPVLVISFIVGLNIFIGLVSLAMFIEKIYDAFMKK